MAQINLTESQIRSLYSQFTGKKDFSIVIKSKEDLEQTNLNDSEKYVVKADALVSGRFKKGLIKIGITPQDVKEYIRQNIGITANTFIIQPQVNIEHEYYFSIESFDEYDLIRYSDKGGIEIESNWDSVKEFKISLTEGYQLNDKDLPNNNIFKEVYQFFVDNGFAFLEINPFTFDENGNFIAIDFKGRVDNCFKDNFKFEKIEGKNESEKLIKELDLSTDASLKFKLLNPDARIWPMVAGGGASIVYFDLIAEKFGIENVGFYGEYSGNPTRDLTYKYSKEIIANMLKSSAKDKILLIAGGNANFTDISKTFDGIIDAMNESAEEMRNQNITVIVRRAGPFDKIGLKKMKDFLIKNNLSHKVFGIETEMTDVFDKPYND